MTINKWIKANHNDRDERSQSPHSNTYACNSLPVDSFTAFTFAFTAFS